MNSKPALLIIAYMRFESVARIVNSAIESGIERIYISVDGADGIDLIQRQDSLVNMLREICKDKPVEVKIRFSKSNLGCAASVLSGCDWVFTQEEFVAVLEDDCIPSSGFFQFLKDGYETLRDSEDVWMLCGTQFAPEQVTESKWVFSRYALIWGWSTTRSKWKEMSLSIRNFKYIPIKFNSEFSENFYWNSGARRAHLGWVDAWDTLLVQQMILKGKCALLPGQNLVQNIGQDNFATHTTSDSVWLNNKVTVFKAQNLAPTVSPKVDSWIKSNFYQVNLSHPFRFVASFLLDSLGIRGKKGDKLSSRWDRADLNQFFVTEISDSK